MKDYYQILEITPATGEDDIRRNYRKLAMQYHPDRNPDDLEAENRFKEVAEAYGVLTDPVKKRAYDRARVTGTTWNENGGADGFNYSQEDILRDLFRDPRFQQMFQGLLREFQRSGFRANSRFIRQSFFGGRGTLLFGGLFLFGSLAGPVLMKSARKGLSGKDSVLKSFGSGVKAILASSKPKDIKPTQPASYAELDITYITPLTAEELSRGKVVQVVSQGPAGQEMLKVKIPPGSRAGQKLRLAGKGAQGKQGRGNLYLELKEQ
jgi:curved DNA-binding protein